GGGDYHDHGPDLGPGGAALLPGRGPGAQHSVNTANPLPPLRGRVRVGGAFVGTQTGRAGWLAWVAGVLLLVGRLVGAHFYLKRPGPAEDGSPQDAAFNVVCAGHVDAERGVSLLTVAVPGRVIEIRASEGQDVAKDEVLLKLDDTAAK